MVSSCAMSRYLNATKNYIFSKLVKSPIVYLTVNYCNYVKLRHLFQKNLKKRVWRRAETKRRSKDVTKMLKQKNNRKKYFERGGLSCRKEEDQKYV